MVINIWEAIIATETTGSQSENKEQGITVKGDPWNFDWGVAKQAAQAVSQGINEARAPWELDWGIAPTEARVKPPKPVKTPTKTTPSRSAGAGEDWAEINAQNRAGQRDRDIRSLHTLQTELANEKNPENIKRLNREIAKVQKLIKE